MDYQGERQLTRLGVTLLSGAICNTHRGRGQWHMPWCTAVRIQVECDSRGHSFGSKFEKREDFVVKTRQ